MAEAIAHANRILDWHENLLPNEVPPEWMWPFAEELNDWFAEVKAAKEAQAEGDESPTEMVKNDDPRVARLRALRG